MEVERPLQKGDIPLKIQLGVDADGGAGTQASRHPSHLNHGRGPPFVLPTKVSRKSFANAVSATLCHRSIGR
jgi:hypothetical protein